MKELLLLLMRPKKIVIVFFLSIDFFFHAEENLNTKDIQDKILSAGGGRQLTTTSQPIAGSSERLSL
jgi:hypothetical protein